MPPSMAVITLAVADLARARRFYEEGFGWPPVFANEEIVFTQMNGFVLGLWQRQAMEADTGRAATESGAVALAHNVRTEAEVAAVMERLLASGGTLLRPADAPPHGGRRGYVADPDGHAWEIAWNPVWPIDDQGRVTFSPG